MKKVLAIVKGNLVIVVVVVLALLAIPAILFFSSRWNHEIREKVSEDVSKTMSSLNGIPVTYEISEMMTGGEAWQSDRVAPNQVVNNKMKSILETLSSEAEAVRELAIKRNSAGKTLLISGSDARDRLFPAPIDESARVRLLTELTRIRPKAYADLLKQARVGMPPDPADVMRQLEARRTRLIQDLVRGRVEQKLSDDEQAQIRDQLSKERMEIYQQAASRLSMYGDPSVFVGVREWHEEDGLPTLAEAWEWQMRYWVSQDLIDALKKANTESSGLWMQVPAAPVKRILSVKVEAMSDSGGGIGFNQDAAPAPTDPNAPISPTYKVAYTGRAGYPTAPNALYDVRYATLDLIVDMNRLPDLLDAITTTNFMSVVGLDFEAVDPQDALRDGFVYGGDAVARATIRVESVWLRSWMKQWMPATVREQLGIPEDKPEATEGAGSNG